MLVVLSVIVLMSDWVVCVLMIGVVTEVEGIVMVVPDWTRTVVVD